MPHPFAPRHDSPSPAKVWSVQVRRDAEQSPAVLLIEVRDGTDSHVCERRNVFDDWSLWEFLENLPQARLFAHALFGRTEPVRPGDAIRLLSSDPGTRVTAQFIATAPEMRTRLDRLSARTRIARNEPLNLLETHGARANRGSPVRT